MSLSPEVVRGLEAELRRLEDERRRLDITTASIRQLLGHASPSHEAPPDHSAAPPTGFRNGIRGVLKAAGKPLSTKEISDAIRAQRYPGWDFENLTSRLHNDLWKMKEAGQLAKSGDGYALAGGGGEGAIKR